MTCYFFFFFCKRTDCGQITCKMYMDVFKLSYIIFNSPLNCSNMGQNIIVFYYIVITYKNISLLEQSRFVF